MDGRWEVRCSAVGGKGRGRKKEAPEIPRRTANERLRDSIDLPKVVIASDETSMAHLGSPRLLIAPPLMCDEIMKTVPYGSVTTSEHRRSLLVQWHGVDSTCQLTAEIFITIVAQASGEREHDKTPFWRTLKKAGELNPRYPGGIERQGARLEAEGHTVVQNRRRCFVKDYEKGLAGL